MNVGGIKRKNTCIPPAQYKRFIVDGWDADITKLSPALSSVISVSAVGCDPVWLVGNYKIDKISRARTLSANAWRFYLCREQFSLSTQLWLATKAWQIVTTFNSKSSKTFLSFLSKNDCVELRLRCHKMPGYNLLLLFVKVTSHEWIQIWYNLCYPGPGLPGGKQMPSKDFNSHKSQPHSRLGPG